MVAWLTSLEMQFRLIGGLTVRFAVSEGRGDHAMLLSPWPESLLAFEPVWWQLAKRTHLVAVDLPGFGHSQRSDSLLSRRRWASSSSPPPDAFGLEHPHVVARHRHRGRAVHCGAAPDAAAQAWQGDGSVTLPDSAGSGTGPSTRCP